MEHLKITRYRHPMQHGWAGYVEPPARDWIAFIGLDGLPRVFLHRDPVTGAILPEDPAEHEKHLTYLRGEGADALRIGMAYDGRDGASIDLEPGERVFPLGADGRAGRDALRVAGTTDCAECGRVLGAVGEPVAHADCDAPGLGVVDARGGYVPSSPT